MGKVVKGTDINGNEVDMNVEELYFRPAVYGIVIKDEKVLMITQNFGYSLPGGGLDLGETFEEALVREMKEETGYEVESVRLLEATSQFFKLPWSNKNAQTLRFFF